MVIFTGTGHRRSIHQSVSHPAASEKSRTNRRYRKKCPLPRQLFRALRLMIFVAGPVIMKAAALPGLMPFRSHA